MTKATESVLAAANIIASNSLNVFSTGGSDVQFISMMEHRLGLVLPDSFKLFLREYGILAVESEEFYGEFDDADFATAIPSFVFATENSRRLKEIGNFDIYVKPTGYGPDVVVDCSVLDIDREAPVFRQSANYDRKTGKVDYVREKIANSYGEFFLNEIVRIASEKE